MSNATAEDTELAELKQQIEQEAEANKAKAAEQAIEPTPSPEPPVSQAPEPVAETPTPVTPNQSQVETPKDDPMEWAKKKGFKTPEDMARALLQKEQEFHQSRQQKGQEQPPQQPAWQPAPQMGYGYPPPPQYGYPPPQAPSQRLAAMYPQLAPEDIDRVMPLIMDAAETVALRRTSGLQNQLAEIQRSTSRNNELMALMQDPAFRDERVQKEVHAILDSDPTIFQRERTPLVYAFKEAVFNMGRKQLQQGVSNGNEAVRGSTPPVTAGGGNGSANTVLTKPTEREMESWTPEQMKAYMTSNGRILPKAK